MALLSSEVFKEKVIFTGILERCGWKVSEIKVGAIVVAFRMDAMRLTSI
jgi:hypothetical protein